MPRNTSSVLVTSFGAVYRIPTSNYRRQLQSIIDGEGYSLPNEAQIGQIETDMSGLDPEEATYMLNALNERLKRK